MGNAFDVAEQKLKSENAFDRAEEKLKPSGAFDVAEQRLRESLPVYPEIKDISEPPPVVKPAEYKKGGIAAAETIGLPPAVAKRKEELQETFTNLGMEEEDADTASLIHASTEFQGKSVTKSGWILPSDWEYKEREEKFHWLVGQYIARPATDFARGKLFNLLDPLFK